MAKAIVGIIGGSGVYKLAGLTDVREQRVATPWGEPSDVLRFGRIGETEAVFLARHGQGHRFTPVDDQLSRQHRRAEAGRRHRRHRRLGLRLVPRGAVSRPVRAGRPVRGPHLRAPDELLRRRLRRPCADGASDLAAVARARRRRRRRRGDRLPQRRNLPLHGRAAILDARRVARLQGARPRRHRHDRGDRGQARARSGTALRRRRHGHRLRLLARGARAGRRRLGAEGRASTTPSGSRRCSRARSRISPPSTSRARAAPTARSTARS